MDARSAQLDAAHEARCRRCGRCCFHKFLVGDTIIYTDTPCPYLSLDSMECTVYERRHEVNVDCLNVEKGIERGVFPADCPYVVDLPGYKAPIEDASMQMLGELIESLETEEVDT